MKTGIRTKLAVLFILIVLIPVLCSSAATFLLYTFNKDAREYAKSAYLLKEAFDLVNRNYNLINEYDAFSAAVRPMLVKINGRLQVIGVDGRLLYDSEDREASLEGDKVSIEDAYGFEPEYFDKVQYVHKHVNPITFEGSLAANAVIVKDMQGFGNGIGQKLTLYGIVFFIVGLILLIIIFNTFIRKNFLEPLYKLNLAAESIMHGNLDFTVEHNTKDEVGQFCKAFDMMRIKLKESLELQVLNENARRELLAGISHDLRTPITSIKGYVEGLQDGIPKDPAKFGKYLSVIKSKTAGLDRLIEDLFQFTQHESGSLKIELTEQNSREMFESIIVPMQADYECGMLKLTVNRPLPSVVIAADSFRIKQVMDNLIENARRHAGEACEVEISMVIREKLLIVYIRDNGAGIAFEDMPHIFERFYRGEKSLSRNYGGMGIGLAICRHIIEEHRGRIWLESTSSSGSASSSGRASICESIPSSGSASIYESIPSSGSASIYESIPSSGSISSNGSAPSSRSAPNSGSASSSGSTSICESIPSSGSTFAFALPIMSF